MSDVERLRTFVEQYVPKGFRDDDGVWHEAPHRRDALAALDRIEGQLCDLLAERELGPQPWLCPNRECSVATVGTAYDRNRFCPRCNTPLVRVEPRG